MGTTYLTTSTNFAQSVTTQVLRDLVASLRAGLPYMPAGSVKNARLLPGGNGTIRAFNISDIPDGAGAGGLLTEAVPPTTQDLAHDYIDAQTYQRGAVVKLSDLSMAESPFDMLNQASLKVRRSAELTLDELVRLTYAAQAPEIVATTTITADNVINAVATMRARNVEPLANNLYVGITSPSVAADLSRLTDWVGINQFAKPENLTNGVIGVYRGCAIVVSSRAITSFGTATGALTSVAATDIITSAAHGLLAGQRIQFAAGLTGGAGLTIGTSYYVIGTNLAANTFMVSATKGGATIDHTTNITAGTFAAESHRLQIVGKDSILAGDLQSLEVHVTPPGGHDDPLFQSALAGWKVRFGSALIKLNELDAAAGGALDVPRTVGVDSKPSFIA
jgi:N4-gp56 family major capsid protein